jgi:nicotinamide riboside transporter PnuC
MRYSERHIMWLIINVYGGRGTLRTELLIMRYSERHIMWLIINVYGGRGTCVHIIVL